MMTLKTILNQHLGPNAANELSKLIEDYQAAHVTGWLIESIQPLTDGLRTKLSDLERVEAEARQVVEQAQIEANEAAHAALQAGTGVLLATTESRIKTARTTTQRGQELSNIIADISRTRQKLEKIERLLSELEAITPPTGATIREIVRQRVS